MHQIKVQHLLEILQASEFPVEENFQLEVNSSYLIGKGENLLKKVFVELGGKGNLPSLEHLKFDFKINRYVFVYDDAIHFNRYRLSTLKSDLFLTFSFLWLESYKSLQDF